LEGVAAQGGVLRQGDWLRIKEEGGDVERRFVEAMKAGVAANAERHGE
jgi:hypothetical protein